MPARFRKGIRWMTGVALALLLAVFMGAPAAAPLAAQTRTGHDFTYYSDDTYTTVVGYQFWCIGSNGGWGVTTPYVIIGDYPCPGD
jgi:hypothetical protein